MVDVFDGNIRGYYIIILTVWFAILQLQQHLGQNFQKSDRKYTKSGGKYMKFRPRIINSERTFCNFLARFLQILPRHLSHFYFLFSFSFWFFTSSDTLSGVQNHMLHCYCIQWRCFKSDSHYFYFSFINPILSVCYFFSPWWMKVFYRVPVWHTFRA